MKKRHSLATILPSFRRLGTSKAGVFMVLGLLTLCLGTPARSQVSTASMNGTVQDNMGALVPGAKIVVVQTQTNFTSETLSGPDGSFRVPAIPVGPYVIRVSKDGFSKFEQGGIVLTVGQVATLPITLNVGSATQNVVVTAEAPAVESTSSTIQNVVEDQAVVNLPLNGRNPAALVNTVPGVTDAALNSGNTTPNSTVKTGVNLDSQSAPTTNGVRPGGTYFSLDGAGNVDPLNVIGGPFPNPDATQSSLWSRDLTDPGMCRRPAEQSTSLANQGRTSSTGQCLNSSATGTSTHVITSPPRPMF